MPGSTITNQPGALFEFQTDADIIIPSGLGLPAGAYEQSRVTAEKRRVGCERIQRRRRCAGRHERRCSRRSGGALRHDPFWARFHAERRIDDVGRWQYGDEFDADLRGRRVARDRSDHGSRQQQWGNRAAWLIGAWRSLDHWKLHAGQRWHPAGLRSAVRLPVHNTINSMSREQRRWLEN